MKICGLKNAPVFSPIVAPYYSGMEVAVSLRKEELLIDPAQIPQLYRSYYQKGLVSFVENADESGFLSAAAYSGRDDLEITLVGNEDRLLVVARFDNLGKGASGSAIQNMNLLLGVDEAEGLCIGG